LLAAAAKEKQMTSGHQKVVVILFIFFSPLTSYSSIKVAQNQSLPERFGTVYEATGRWCLFLPAQLDSCFEMLLHASLSKTPQRSVYLFTRSTRVRLVLAAAAPPASALTQ
jgi:hypothetical protein